MIEFWVMCFPRKRDEGSYHIFHPIKFNFIFLLHSFSILSTHITTQLHFELFSNETREFLENRVFIPRTTFADWSPLITWL